MIFTALVSGYFRSDGLRAVVTVAAIALAVGLLLAVQLTTAVAERAFEGTVRVVSDRVNLQIAGGPGGFDERTFAAVRRISEIREAAPIVEGTFRVADARAGSSSLRVIGVDSLQPLPGSAPRSGEFPGPFAPRGTGPDPALLIDGDGAFVSEPLAQRYRLHSGDRLNGTVSGHARSLVVAEIESPPLAGVDSNVVFVDVATAQELFGAVGRLDRIDCVVPPEQLGRVRALLAVVLPTGVRALEPAFGTRAIAHILAPLRVAFGALTLVALVVSAFLVYNGVAASVVQRRADIGSLRALGATRAAIFWAFVGEGAVLGGAGALLGFLLGTYLARYAAIAFLHALQAAYGPLPIPDSAADPAASVGAVAFGVGIALISAAIPAYAASSISPAAAIRTLGSEHASRDVGSRALVAAFVLALLAAGATVVAVRSGGVRDEMAAVVLLALAALAAIRPALASLARAGRSAGTWISPAARVALETLASAPQRVSVAVAATTLAIAATLATLVVVSSARLTVETWARQTIAAGDARTTALGAFDGPFAAASTIAASITALALLGSVTMLYAFVLERRREIAILRWLGMSKAAVRALVVYEAIAMGALACMLGCVLGLALTAVLFRDVPSGAFGAPLILHVPYAMLAVLLVAILGSLALAALYPARVAARIQSDVELRAA